jgi:hypothetical protein
MYRRIVSLLLLPCVLLSESAALGHSHGGSEPAGHDLRPHFHTTPASTRHEQAHHHHDNGDDPAEPDSQPTPQPEPLSEDEHDSDAVIIDRAAVVLCQRSAFGDELATSLVWAVSALHVPTKLCADPLREAVNWTHAPPPRGYACPLYLWQLTLLI